MPAPRLAGQHDFNDYDLRFAAGFTENAPPAAGLASLPDAYVALLACVGCGTTASRFCNGVSIPLPGQEMHCWS